MNHARPFLSRPPQCEPPLGDLGEAPLAYVRPSQAPRRTPHSGRSNSPAIDHKHVEIHAAARQFTEQALRRTLEVLDRRRPHTQLRAMLEPALVDMMRVLSTAPRVGRELGAASLERVHLRVLDGETADFFGSYTRRERVFAVAGRVSRRPDIAGWRVVALQLG